MDITAKQIRMARAGLKLSQKALAEGAGINRDTLSAIEAGGTPYASTVSVVVDHLKSLGAEFGADGWVRVEGHIVDEDES